MREILCRGRCTGEDDYWGWQEGFYVCLRDPYKKRESHRIYSGFAEADCENFYGDWYEVDPSTVGQFTGLTDKNGKRIFEGDIVKDITDGVPREVFYCNESAMFLKKGILRSSLGNPLHLEVIGNIHDNPELLGG